MGDRELEMQNNYTQILSHKYYRFGICIVILFVLYIAVPSRLWGYDVIQTFDTTDIYFQKLQTLLERNDDTPYFFEYQVQSQDTLLTISKKTRTSISALITVNRSNVFGNLQAGDYIIIPSVRGVFLTLRPKSDLEFLIHYRVYSDLSKEQSLFISKANQKYSEPFYFMPDIPLSKKEYLLWTHTAMRHPILQGYITSYFGERVSPFSGNKIHHNGIDIASHSGSEIFAVLSGEVIKKDYNPIYGYYIIIEHQDKLKTLYGHLLDTTVKVGEQVYIGQHIAYMGNTGASTGPHVHFEIHKNNTPINPINILALQ